MKISKIFLTLGLAAILVAPIVQAQSFDFLTEEQRALVVSGFQKEYIQRGLAIAVSQPGITPRVAGAVSLNTSLTTGLISGLANLLNQKTTPTVPTGAYTTPPSTQPGGTLTTGGLSGSNVNSNPCNYNKVCEQVRGESTNNCPTDCLLNQGGSMLTSQNANIGSGSQTSGVTNSGLPSFRFGCTTSGQCQLDQQGFYPEWYPDLMSCKAKCVNKNLSTGTGVSVPGIVGGTGSGSVGNTSNEAQVITKPATNIASNAATLNGSVVSLANCPSVEAAFELQSSAGKKYILVGVRSTTGDFSANVTGLTPNSNYLYTAMIRCTKEYPASAATNRDLSREPGWMRDGQLNFMTLPIKADLPSEQITGEAIITTLTYQMANPLTAQLQGKVVNGLALAAKARDKMAFCGFITYDQKDSEGISHLVSASNPPLVEQWIAHPLRQVPPTGKDFTFETSFQAYKPDANNTSTDPFAAVKCFRAYCRAGYYPDPTIPAVFGEEICITKNGPPTPKPQEPTTPTETPNTQNIVLLDSSKVIKAIGLERANIGSGRISFDSLTKTFTSDTDFRYTAKGQILASTGGRILYYFYAKGSTAYSDKDLVANWQKTWADWEKMPESSYKHLMAPGMQNDQPGNIQSNPTPVGNIKATDTVCVKIGFRQDNGTDGAKYYISNEYCYSGNDGCTVSNGVTVCPSQSEKCGQNGVVCATVDTLAVCKAYPNSQQCLDAIKNMSIQGITKPEVQTLEISNVTTNSMTITGNLVKLGGTNPVSGELAGKYNTYVSFMGGAKASITPKQRMTAPGVFSYTINELRPGTSYCWTAVAWNVETSRDVAVPAGLASNFGESVPGGASFGQQLCVKTLFGDVFEKPEEMALSGFKTSLDDYGVNWNSADVSGLPIQVSSGFLSVGGARDAATMYGTVRKIDTKMTSVAPMTLGFGFNRSAGPALASPLGGSSDAGQTYFVVVESGAAVAESDKNFEYKMMNMTAGSGFTYYPFAIYNGKIYKGMFGNISAPADNSIISPDLKTLENGKLERANMSGYYKAELKGQVLKVGTAALNSIAVGFEIVSADDTSLGANYHGFVQGIKSFSYPGDLTFVFDRIRSGYKYCYKVANNSAITGKTNYAADEYCFTAPTEDDWKLAPVATTTQSFAALTPEQKCAYCRDGVETPPNLMATLGSAAYGSSQIFVCGADGYSYKQSCFNTYCRNLVQLKSTGKCATTALLKTASPTSPAKVSVTLIRPETIQWNELQSSKQKCDLTDRGEGIFRITLKLDAGVIRIPKKGAFIASNYSGGIFVKNVEADSIKYETGLTEENGFYVMRGPAMANFTINVGIDPHPVYFSGVRTFAQLVSLTYIDNYTNNYQKISFDNTYQTVGVSLLVRKPEYRLVKFGDDFCGLNAGGSCAGDNECVQQGVYRQICVAQSAMNTACLVEDGYRNCWYSQTEAAANYTCKCVDDSQTLSGNVYVKSGKCAWAKTESVASTKPTVYPVVSLVSTNIVKKDNSGLSTPASDSVEGTIIFDARAVGGDIYINIASQSVKGIGVGLTKMSGEPADPSSTYTYACASGCEIVGTAPNFAYIVREGQTARFGVNSVIFPKDNNYYYSFVKAINWHAYGSDQTFSLTGSETLGALKTQATFLVYRGSQSTSTKCACPLNYDPVCGVDGKVYGNECAAKCANVSVQYKGECVPETTQGCVDSDNGRNYLIQGTVTGGNNKCFDGKCVDSCWDGGGFTVNGFKLSEWYCENGIAKNEVVDCPDNTCIGGACKASATQTQNNLTANPVVANLPWDANGTKMAGTITLNRFANTGAYVGFIKTTMPMYGVGSIKVETVYWPNPPKIFTKDNGSQFEIAITKPSVPSTICYDAFVRMGNYYKKVGLQKCRVFR